MTMGSGPGNGATALCNDGTYSFAAHTRAHAHGTAGSRCSTSRAWSDRGRPDLAQPITKVRVRHHQVDQPAVLGTRCTRHAQRARVTTGNDDVALLSALLTRLAASEATQRPGAVRAAFLCCCLSRCLCCRLHS